MEGRKTIAEYVHEIDPTIVLVMEKRWACAACNQKIEARCRCPAPDFCKECDAKFDGITAKIHRGDLRI